MSRPKIMVTNVDKNGRVTDKWHVRVGNKWRIVTQKDVMAGIEWINTQLKQHGRKAK